MQRKRRRSGGKASVFVPFRAGARAQIDLTTVLPIDLAVWLSFLFRRTRPVGRTRNILIGFEAANTGPPRRASTWSCSRRRSGRRAAAAARHRRARPHDCRPQRLAHSAHYPFGELRHAPSWSGAHSPYALPCDGTLGLPGDRRRRQAQLVKVVGGSGGAVKRRRKGKRGAAVRRGAAARKGSLSKTLANARRRAGRPLGVVVRVVVAGRRRTRRWRWQSCCGRDRAADGCRGRRRCRARRASATEERRQARTADTPPKPKPKRSSWRCMDRCRRLCAPGVAPAFGPGTPNGVPAPPPTAPAFGPGAINGVPPPADG